MVEQQAGPFNDGQTQPHTFGRRSAGIKAVEFAENVLSLGFWNAGAGVNHIDPACAIEPARPDQNAAAGRVPYGIANQVLQNAPQIGGIAFDRRRACDNVKADALMRGDRREFVAQLCKDLAKADRGDIDRSLAGFEFRDVEQAFSSVMPALSASASSETEAMNSLAAQSSCSRS